MSYTQTTTVNPDGSTTIRTIASDDPSWPAYYLEASPTKPECAAASPDYPLYTMAPSCPLGPLGGYTIGGVRYQKSLFLEHPIAGDFTGGAPVGLTPRFILPTIAPS